MERSADGFKAVIIGSSGVGKRTFLISNSEVNCRVQGSEGEKQVFLKFSLDDASTDPKGDRNAVLLMYSLADNNSFEELDRHYKEATTRYPNRLMILVGNKSDSVQWEVSSIQAREFAVERGMMYAEISTASGKNIAGAVNELMNELARRTNNIRLLDMPRRHRRNHDLQGVFIIAGVYLGVLALTVVGGVGYFIKYLVWG